MQRLETEIRKAVAKLFGPHSGWRACIAIDINGNYAGKTDTSAASSAAVSNPEDRELLIALRALTEVIVTTGKTARAEGYKNSKFAPIAVLSNQPDSLTDLPLFADAPTGRNFILTAPADERFASQLEQSLNQAGFNSFLFEGGPATLRRLHETGADLELVISVTGSTRPEELDPREYLDRLLPNNQSAEVLNDLLIGNNRVTRWLIGGGVATSA